MFADQVLKVDMENAPMDPRTKGSRRSGGAGAGLAWLASILVASILVLASLATVGAAMAADIKPSVEELEARLSSQTGSERVETLIELTRSYRTLPPPRAIAYGKEAIELLEAHPVALERHVELQVSLSYCHYLTGEYETSLSWARQALELSEEKDFDLGRWRSLRMSAIAHGVTGEYQQAQSALHRARPIVDSLQDPSILSDYLVTLGFSYTGQGFDSLALEAYLEALDHERQVGNQHRIAVNLNNIAATYTRVGDHEKALGYQRQALELHRLGKDRRRTANSHFNIGSVLTELGRYDEAEESLAASLAISEETDNRSLTVRVLEGMARNARASGRTEEAVARAEQALAMARVVGVEDWLAESFETYARALLDLDRIDEALTAAGSALEASAASEDRQLPLRVHRTLAEVYQKAGRFREALSHQQTYQQLYEDLFTEASRKRIEELQIRFETADKDREIAKLAHAKDLADVELARQKAIRNASIGGAVSILGIATLIAWGYRTQQRSHRKLVAAYNELEVTYATLNEQRAVHRDLERLVDERTAQLKVLQGLLPICTTCKKIRDDDGYWREVEVYINAHSEARFSHGICPSCFEDYSQRYLRNPSLAASQPIKPPS